MKPCSTCSTPRSAWKTAFAVKRPGVYVFYMEPQPYWEPTEDAFIVHYTKTVVAAFGDEIGWDAEIGLKTEIVPLSRPFGLYAGNVFQGIVKLDGKPAPFAEVEVEYYNVEQKLAAPTDYMITQAIKAWCNGSDCGEGIRSQRTGVVDLRRCRLQSDNQQQAGVQ